MNLKVRTNFTFSDLTAGNKVKSTGRANLLMGDVNSNKDDDVMIMIIIIMMFMMMMIMIMMVTTTITRFGERASLLTDREPAMLRIEGVR